MTKIYITLLNATGSYFQIKNMKVNTKDDIQSGDIVINDITDGHLGNTATGGDDCIIYMAGNTVKSEGLCFYDKNSGNYVGDKIHADTIYSIKWDWISGSVYGIDSSIGVSTSRPNFKYNIKNATNLGISISENLSSDLNYVTGGLDEAVVCFGISRNGEYYYTTYEDDPNIVFMDQHDDGTFYPTTLKNLSIYDYNNYYLHILVALPIESYIITDNNMLRHMVTSGEMLIKNMSNKSDNYTTAYPVPIMQDEVVTSDILNAITVD